jgi:hypothetical protein
MFSSTAYGVRRRRDVTAESSTGHYEVDPHLVQEIHDLFERGSYEFFQDGIYSDFSRTLLKLLSQHGRDAVQAIAEYLFSGKAKPDVASEALRWVGDMNDSSTKSQRWHLLSHSLHHKSSKVRDGAILGFAALDDPRAHGLLKAAKNVEQLRELQILIDQVLAQLERNR